MVFLSNAAEALQLNGSILVVIVLFVAYHFLMRAIFYRPLARVLDERERRTTGSQADAGEAKAASDRLLADYEAAVKRTRLEGFAQADRVRAEANARREDTLRRTQQQAGQDLAEARAAIGQALAAERQVLEGRMTEFAHLIAARILAREVGR